MRQSAEVACRTLSKVRRMYFNIISAMKSRFFFHVCNVSIQVSIRICDVNQGKLGETAIALILPTLVHKGMTDNSAEEVRKIR